MDFGWLTPTKVGGVFDAAGKNYSIEKAPSKAASKEHTQLLFWYFSLDRTKKSTFKSWRTWFNPGCFFFAVALSEGLDYSH